MATLTPPAAILELTSHRSYIDRTRRYQLADLAQVAVEDGYRYEICDGELIMTPTPGRAHAGMALRLISIIQSVLAEAKPAWCLLPQPINLEIETDETTYHCEPDLSIFDRPLEAVVADETLSPAIVIEIVSPGNPENDYVRKVDAYAAIGIPEYWIVDPGNRAITYLRLIETAHGQRYIGQGASLLAPEIVVDPALLFVGLL